MDEAGGPVFVSGEHPKAPEGDAKSNGMFGAADPVLEADVDPSH